ncbi:sigma factor-like helix-turn-helix DNA-binding protein [Pseudaquabacterium pictum]|uniref:RNA polymerase sigma-70 domain-containing protein n=1 Tax=Pseudaquabacterium pictum TaxID=2315236 RepID=A0A480AKI8_9BURK|nr:sigma factor-like helix-turn-helix DNA-binding protein [Rubrivivax pictus]GCL61526.1 hypothetical protein AQPW35_06070 [Rubrivivax pictus]
MKIACDATLYRQLNATVGQRPRGRQPYGSRWSALHGEAYRMWLSSGDEPAETPAFGMRALMVLEDDDDKAGAACAQLWRLALRHLTWREVDVLRFRYIHDLTLKETGARMLVTQERVRQIEVKALGVLQRLANRHVNP